MNPFCRTKAPTPIPASSRGAPALNLGSRRELPAPNCATPPSWPPCSLSLARWRVWCRAGCTAMRLRAETRELAIQTVSVVSPAPGKSHRRADRCPPKSSRFVEAPIYARASGYLKRYLVDIGSQVKAGDLLAEIDTPELNQQLAQARARTGPGRRRPRAGQDHRRALGRPAQDRQRQRAGSRREAGRPGAQAGRRSRPPAPMCAGWKNCSPSNGSPRPSPAPSPCGKPMSANWWPRAAARNSSAWRKPAPCACMCACRKPSPSSVAPGQMAELTIPELPGRVFPAKVVRTSGAMSADSRTLLAELEVDNSRGEILAGTYAQVRFTEAKADPALDPARQYAALPRRGPASGCGGRG